MNNKYPEKTTKPWGYEILYALNEHYAGKIIFIKKGHRLSLQYHEKKTETMYIHSGRARLEAGSDAAGLACRIIKEGQNLHLPAGTLHRIQALEDTIILEVSTPELDDVVRLADDYGRT